MASNSQNNSEKALQQAFSALSKSLNRLDAAAAVSVEQRKNASQTKELAQEEITESWQRELAKAESERDALSEERAFLKEDNLRLSTQLQALQQEYLSLQEVAGQTLNRLDGSVKQLDMLLEH